MKVTISKKVLFQLAASHSRLAQAEYNRDPGYNDQHFSHKAEDALIKESHEIGIFDELVAAIGKDVDDNGK